MTEIRDATPDWAKLEWANGEIERLKHEVSRRDVVLRWLQANTPRALELCPFKLGGEYRTTSNQDDAPASRQDG